MKAQIGLFIYNAWISVAAITSFALFDIVRYFRTITISKDNSQPDPFWRLMAFLFIVMGLISARQAFFMFYLMAQRTQNLAAVITGATFHTLLFVAVLKVRAYLYRIIHPKDGSENKAQK